MKLYYRGNRTIIGLQNRILNALDKHFEVRSGRGDQSGWWDNAWDAPACGNEDCDYKCSRCTETEDDPDDHWVFFSFRSVVRSIRRLKAADRARTSL